MAFADFLRCAALTLAPLGGVALSSAVLAEPPAGSDLNAGTLEVPVNKSQVVSTDRPIAKAMVGSSEIADILPITDRSIYVLGKKMGTTSLTLYDSGGRVLAIMDVAVGPDVQAFREQAAQLIPGQQIDARISGDSMVLTGLVTDPGAVDKAMQLAKTYAGDKVVNMLSVGGSQQVMLEVRFAEVNTTAAKDIGVKLFGGNGGNFDAVSGTGASLVPGANGVGVLKQSSIVGSFGIFRRTNINIAGLTVDAMINALETKGFAKTLAQPTLLALSGETASFLAGGEFPVPVAQSGNSGSGTNSGGGAITVQFKPFGVSLGFTPTVLGDHTINLKVEPEVSQIDPSASVTINGLSIPGLRTRRASTTLELRDGESFAIAGLLSRDFGTTVNQVPLLGSIPIIGALFRSTQFKKGETELLIVVTPRLVAPIRPDQVHLPTDTVKDPDEASAFLLGQTHQKPVPPDAAAKTASGDGYEY
jgi:pilus assembly protein CpaC